MAISLNYPVQSMLSLAILFAVATRTSTCTPSPSPSSRADVKGLYWLENPLFPPSAIDTSLFTHVFYAFLAPNNLTNELHIPPSTATSLTSFTTTLRTKTPPVTTLLSIGGAGPNSKPFPLIASRASSRAIFIASTIDAARTFGFDGVDLDWEFPKTPGEMSDLGELLLELRRAVAADSAATGRPPLLLTAAVYFAVSMSLSGEPRVYPVESINQNLDWVNVMSYDLRGSWANVTGAPAGLFDPKSNLSVASGLVYWIRGGVLPEKMVMGLPLYGRTWRLRDPSEHGIGAPAVGSGPGLDGAMAYFQVLDFNNETGASVVRDVDTVSVYSYSGSSWIGYDDPFTVRVKVGFARSLSLRGYFFWVAGLDTSDWKISTQASKAWMRE